NRDFESSVDASAGNEVGAPDARGPDVSVEASGDARLDAALDGPCTNGAPCSPANPCHEGQATCSGAQLVLWPTRSARERTAAHAASDRSVTTAPAVLAPPARNAPLPTSLAVPARPTVRPDSPSAT